MNPPELAETSLGSSPLGLRSRNIKGAPCVAKYAMIKVVWVVEAYFLRVYNSQSTVVLVSIGTGNSEHREEEVL